MNIHIPQSLEAVAELKELCRPQENIITAQTSSNNIKIVQDALLAAYKMTLKNNTIITREQFFQLSMKLTLDLSEVVKGVRRVEKVLKKIGKEDFLWSGRTLISLFLPEDLVYMNETKADPEESKFIIYEGVIISGAITKKVIGSSNYSLITLLNKEYGSEKAAHFIDNIQFIGVAWNSIKAFSIGLGDCIIHNEEQVKDVRNVIDRSFMEARTMDVTIEHKGRKEVKINLALNKAKDVGLKIAKDGLKHDNNFISTVTSGSKGDYFNICQITGLLGQQNLKGNRVKNEMNNGVRSIVHYPFDKEKYTSDMEYESKGFISSSFIKGLNPREFFFHAMSGREGITNTAMLTAVSGYLQRKIVKLTEDMKTQYDGTIRDTMGKIYQFSYGDDGFDPLSMVKKNGEGVSCDVSRLVNKLNLQYEKR